MSSRYPLLKRILADSNDGDDDSKVDALASFVQMQFDSHLEEVINQTVRSVCEEAGIDPQQEIRRAQDGVSSAEWMVQKMIGELLTDGKIKY